MSGDQKEPPRTVASERVLVIDDDVELCQLVTRYMAAEGFAIDCATTGRHGVERALSGDFALVVLDVMMPDVSGFNVLRRIRAKSRTPVLMLTARGDTLDLGGAGLGLAITTRAIGVHGGTVHAMNGDGHGLIVEIELPPIPAK